MSRAQMAQMWQAAKGCPTTGGVTYGADPKISDFGNCGTAPARMVTVLGGSHDWDPHNWNNGWTRDRIVQISNEHGYAGRPAEANTVTRVHASTQPKVTVFGNLTATSSGAGGFLTAYPCDQPRPVASNVNYTPWWTVATFATVKTDSNGDFCVYTPTATHILFDKAGETTAVNAQNPLRTLDTRTTSGKPGAGTVTKVRTFAVNTTALGNFTVTQPDTGGYAVAYPCSQPRPVASNVNYEAGQTVANHVMVRTDNNGEFCVYTTAATHLIWDQAAETASITTTAPTRVGDTRTASGKPGAGTVTSFPTGLAGGTVAVVNMTVTQPDTGGYVTVYPCNQTRPVASNINFTAGRTVANLALSPTDADGNICVYTSSSTHLVVDVDASAESQTVQGSAPVRLLDTRIK